MRHLLAELWPVRLRHAHDELMEAMSTSEADDDLAGVVDDGCGDVEESEAEALPLPAHGLQRAGTRAALGP